MSNMTLSRQEIMDIFFGNSEKGKVKEYILKYCDVTIDHKLIFDYDGKTYLTNFYSLINEPQINMFNIVKEYYCSEVYQITQMMKVWQEMGDGNSTVGPDDKDSWDIEDEEDEIN